MTFFIEQNDDDTAPSSAAEPTTPPQENVPTVGAVLRARRLELGLKHKDIAREIKIKAEYLKAIEDEDFELLPAPEYLRLFLRTYAQYLKFDTQEIYALYDTQEPTAKRPEKKDPRHPVPPPEQPANRLKMYIAIAAAFVIILLACVVLFLRPVRKSNVDSEAATPQSDAAPAINNNRAAVPYEEVVSEISPSATHFLYVRGLDSTWMVIQADRDTVFLGFIAQNETRFWTADSSFTFTLSHYDGAEAAIDGQYLKPFRQWNGPIQDRNVGLVNLELYLDSTRLDQQAPKTGIQ